ncbi:MAG: LPS export ABC transporter periplasmic protein LptC, partial [Elusimicrobiota bacterium]
RVLFYENGNPASTLSAAEGKAVSGSGNISARGNVVWKSDAEGIALYTPNGEYDSVRNLVVSSSTVRIVYPDKEITGVGFEATPDLSRIVIKNNRVVIQK